VRNLLYQLKVKLLAELAGLASVNAEGDQLVIRFRSGAPPPDLADTDPAIRTGKTGLWMAFSALPDWRGTLLEVLRALPGQAITPQG
jgi:transcription-repair coupling factor (superfamily II helicase)